MLHHVPGARSRPMWRPSSNRSVSYRICHAGQNLRRPLLVDAGLRQTSFEATRRNGLMRVGRFFLAAVIAAIIGPFARAQSLPLDAPIVRLGSLDTPAAASKEAPSADAAADDSATELAKKCISQAPRRSPRLGLCGRVSRRHPDNSMIKAAGGAVRVRRVFQPCLRAVDRTERRVTKVSAPSQLRKPPDIFIFTFIMRISCSA